MPMRAKLLFSLCMVASISVLKSIFRHKYKALRFVGLIKNVVLISSLGIKICKKKRSYIEAEIFRLCLNEDN